MLIIIRFVFHENNKYNPQVMLQEVVNYALKKHDILNKFWEIWNKVKDLIQEDFYVDITINNLIKLLTINNLIKSYKNENNIIHDNGLPPKKSQCLKYSIILIIVKLSLVFKNNKTYYPETLLDEFEYIAKE